MHASLRARLAAALLAASLATALSARAQTIDPAFAGYSFTDLGSVLGIPDPYGPINFAFSGSAIDYNTLIIGGTANDPAGALYSVPVIRNAAHHITGFGGPSTFYADAAYNDGGGTYGPGNVLFLARWPVNQIGETKPGSTTTDKIVDMAPLGVAESTGGLTFVPAGYPGAGQLKYVSWPTGLFYNLTYAPDGSGTFDITHADLVTTLGGGPEGFAYVPLGSAGFAGPSMLMAEFSNSFDPAAGFASIVAYDVDAGGNPIVGSRRVFMSGLTGAEGAVVDPLTGDMLFTTFGAAPDHVIVIQGFAQVVPEPSSLALYATGLVALVGVVQRRRGRPTRG